MTIRDNQRITERSASTISLSIEPTGGKSFQYGFHLGTDEHLAREIAAEKFHARNRAGDFTCTVALIRDRRIIAIYDGTWDRPIQTTRERKED